MSLYLIDSLQKKLNKKKLKKKLKYSNYILL